MLFSENGEGLNFYHEESFSSLEVAVFPSAFLFLGTRACFGNGVKQARSRVCAVLM